MKNRFRVLFSCVAVILMLAATTNSANASHSWGGYHWARTSNPFTLKLGNNLSSSWSPYLNTTSSDWTASSVMDTTVVAGSTSGRRCSPSAGRVQVCNSTYGSNGWLGLAQVWANGTHITQGTVKVNDTYFNQSQYNNSAEKNHVMCQEVGHTLGLDHQSTSGAALGTCMDYSQDVGSQHPNKHDYDQLVTIYSHLDSSSTLNSANIAPEVAAVDMSEPAQWGKQVASDKQVAVYLRDFGNGNTVTTFVYLVDPATTEKSK